MITIVNSGFNNLGSLLHALRWVGAVPKVAQSINDIREASSLLLPGVGSFAVAMDRLVKQGFTEAVVHHARDLGKPTVGICLGMQLLLDESDEHGTHAGLSLIKGRAAALDSGATRERVPRLGWDTVQIEGDHACLPEARSSRDFYFAHSFHAICANSGDVVATTPFGSGQIAAVIARKNVVGCQFHPEKSHDAGMEFLSALVAFCETVDTTNAGPL